MKKIIVIPILMTLAAFKKEDVAKFGFHFAEKITFDILQFY